MCVCVCVCVCYCDCRLFRWVLGAFGCLCFFFLVPSIIEPDSGAPLLFFFGPFLYLFFIFYFLLFWWHAIRIWWWPRPLLVYSTLSTWLRHGGHFLLLFFFSFASFFSFFFPFFLFTTHARRDKRPVCVCLLAVVDEKIRMEERERERERERKESNEEERKKIGK